MAWWKAWACCGSISNSWKVHLSKSLQYYIPIHSKFIHESVIKIHSSSSSLCYVVLHVVHCSMYYCLDRYDILLVSNYHFWWGLKPNFGLGGRWGNSLETQCRSNFLLACGAGGTTVAPLFSRVRASLITYQYMDSHLSSRFSFNGKRKLEHLSPNYVPSQTKSY